MTDITDQDRRVAHEWAASIDPEMDCLSASTRAVARVILATVDAPAPTLAEELRLWAEDASYDEDRDNLLHAAARAEQMEHGIAEARAEVERLTAVQKGAESNAESIDPADVRPGEPWLVECRGERRTAVKDRDDDVPWNTVAADGLFFSEENENITLVARLVPAPRAITNPDELDQVKRRTVIRDAAGVVCERDGMGDAWTTFTSLADQRPHIILPVTVLWEPEA